MKFWYLAGPMRGYAEFNFPAFRRAAAALRAVGLTIVSPAERDEAHGFDPSKSLEANQQANGFTVAKAMEADFRLILSDDCSGVILLPGWEDSDGAKVERRIAEMTGRDVRTFAAVMTDAVEGSE